MALSTSPTAAESLPPPAEPRATPETGPGWLGIELSAVDPPAPGAQVRSVFPTSPAEAAGLRPGDVILRVDGDPVDEPADVGRLVRGKGVGARVNLSLRRGGKDRLLAAVLSAKPDEDELIRKTYLDLPAPAFVGLKAAQGSVGVTTSSLKGKVVVVEFWAGWCQVCRMAAPQLTEWHARIAPQGGMVLGITTGSVPEAARDARGFGMTFPILADESGDTTQAYRAYALPTLFILDRKGVVRDVVIGYSSDDIDGAKRLVDELLAQ
jgi:peroxiredoxin